MEIKRIQDSDERQLFKYWREMGTNIPYFFSVSFEKWKICLLNDMLDGEKLFDYLETYISVDEGEIQGLIQYGYPQFIWDAGGRRKPENKVGVIRHFYYDKDSPDAGNALLKRAHQVLDGVNQLHAFYHILGMSCNAYHGKLHSSQCHVERLLYKHGYQIEHENLYYILDMTQTAFLGGADFSFSEKPTTGLDTLFTLKLGSEVLGTTSVRYLDRLTDGYTRDVVYLSYIGVKKSYQGGGIGTAILRLLVERLRDKGYRFLHTDTAIGNLPARGFYEKQGFELMGSTRSYIG